MTQPIICRFCGEECPSELDEMPCQKCGSDELYRFQPSGTPRNYKELKKALQFKDFQVANCLGISKTVFKNTSAKDRYKEAVIRLYYLFNSTK
jgi:primosomal protein N'